MGEVRTQVLGEGWAFPRVCRINKPSEYRALLQRSRRNRQSQLQNEDFKLINQPQMSSAPPKLGITVSKKAVRRAVDRNRLKRLIRESFRHEQHQLAHEIVVMVKHGAGRKDNRVLRESLNKLWTQLIEHQA